MSESSASMSNAVIVRAGGLLGLPSDDELALALTLAQVIPPALSIARAERLHRQVGLPHALVNAIQACAPSDVSLPLPLASDLLRVITLYALTVEVFGNEEMAQIWWKRPIRLGVREREQAPMEWALDSEAADELIARMRRTIDGIL